jgi:hypothetical protein
VSAGQQAQQQTDEDADQQHRPIRVAEMNAAVVVLAGLVPAAKGGVTATSCRAR